MLSYKKYFCHISKLKIFDGMPGVAFAYGNLASHALMGLDLETRPDLILRKYIKRNRVIRVS